MGYFYLDESIHDEAGFIITSCVYSHNDISPDVDDLLLALGYTPGEDEFKSSAIKATDERSRSLRQQIKDLIHSKTSIGLIVVPNDDRSLLGMESIIGLGRIIRANKLDTETHTIYFDEGIISCREYNMLTKDVLDNNIILWGQDSKKIGGLQVADCVAHTLSIMLKEEMGLVTKKVRAVVMTLTLK